MSEEPIAYTALQKGVAVQTKDGEQIGTVDEVLAVPEEDLFDGIQINTEHGRRFVDADQVQAITTARVRTNLSAQEAEHLPEQNGAPVYDVDPGQDSGSRLTDRLGRLFGRGKWRRHQ